MPCLLPHQQKRQFYRMSERKPASEPARVYDTLRACSFVAFQRNASPVEERETKEFAFRRNAWCICINQHQAFRWNAVRFSAFFYSRTVPLEQREKNRYAHRDCLKSTFSYTSAGLCVCVNSPLRSGAGNMTLTIPGTMCACIKLILPKYSPST